MGSSEGKIIYLSSRIEALVFHNALELKPHFKLVGNCSALSVGIIRFDMGIIISY